MENILFWRIPNQTGALQDLPRNADAAHELAKGIGAELSAGIVGGEVDGALAALAGAGVKRCLTVAGPEFAESRYGSDAAAIEAMSKAAGATVIVAGADSRFSRVLPGVAFRLGGRIDTRLTGLAATDGKPLATRWYYRQRMVANLSRTQRPWVLTVDSGCFEPWQAEGSAPAAEAVKVELPAGCVRTKVTGIQAPPADEQTIRPDADLLFVAGAGWTKKQADGQPRPKDAERNILGFITKTKSSLGSSKSLVDLSGEGQTVLPCISANTPQPRYSRV
jgi:electron transfer flavoprotein alpha subunit